jgi:glucose/arabinose dehydrogenase
MGRFAAALIAGSLIVSACGQTDKTQGSWLDGPPVSSADVTIQIDRPTRPDIPWDETPERARSNTACPSDLPVDSVTPVDEPTVSLSHVVEIVGASALAFATGGTAFIGTREGSVFGWVEGSEPEIVLDLTQVTTTERDQGLLGLAVADGYLFVNRTDLEDDSVVEAYPLINGVPAPGGVIELLRADQPSREHNGGDIVFGPDGHLYLTVGDGGGQGGPFVTGRRHAHAFGSLLRFAISFDPMPTLAAAPDNPFFGSVPGSEYAWVWGLRHPYRFSFDSATGDLWIADVGQQCVEEVTMLPGGGAGGEHLGWNAFEGNLPFMEQPIDSPTPPTFSYGHRSGLCAVIGGHVYRGDALPDLDGKYVFGDFCRRALFSFDPETGVLQELERDTVSPVGFVVGPDGSMYVVDIAQGIWRVDPA